MPQQDDREKDQALDDAGQDGGGAHRDWGHQQAGEAGSQGGNIGGVPGGQHNDWGHSPVDTKSTGLPRQGVMPGEEMGHLQRRKGDT